MKYLLGNEYPAFIEKVQSVPAAGLRVNTLKLTVEKLLSLSPFDLTPLPGIPGAFCVAKTDQPGKHPYHIAGLYYLQDPSAIVAAYLLDPQPGELVLDLSAAPGGKTTQIACLMKDDGLILANEIDRQRVWDLAENLERFGVHRAVITNETPERLADQLSGFFDRILIDAPCSGEGMFWKSLLASQQWSPALVESCAVRQSLILSSAAQLLQPGGRLVYSTCTFAPQENEAVIADFLEAHPDFEIIDLPRLPGFSPGRSDWIQKRQMPNNLDRAVRLWPHHWPGGGQFIAALQKSGQAESQGHKPQKSKRIASEDRQVFEAFCQETFASSIPFEELSIFGSALYELNPDLPDFGRLRLVRPGWWMGNVKKKHFEPSHALAMGLQASAARRVCPLSANDPQLVAYLHGESLSSMGENGWVLVTLDDFPIGWGKRVNGVLKNHYPKGLRRV
jgi:NOL1/NOP2/sun family putative RNA methylase